MKAIINGESEVKAAHEDYGEGEAENAADLWLRLNTLRRSV